MSFFPVSKQSRLREKKKKIKLFTGLVGPYSEKLWPAASGSIVKKINKLFTGLGRSV